MGDRYKQICVFFTHEASSYEYFHVLTLSYANPSSDALNYKSIIDAMKYHVGMHDFIHLGKGEYLVHLLQ
jgi:hypothetical protein